MSKKIALVIAHEGYQPIEYGVTKKTLADEGYSVITVSNQDGFARAEDNSKTEVMHTLQTLDLDDIAGLFFIGGPGALEHLDTQDSYDLIRDFSETHKPLGAICIATRILAHSGVLAGKRATGWDGDEELTGIYQEYGVNYIKEPCVVDDNIITASGPNVAREFAENIVTALEMDNYDELGSEE